MEKDDCQVPSNYYVNKAELLREIRQYQHECREANTSLKIPDTIGKAIIDIANGLSKRVNFRNYPYRDEMVAEGIIAALRAVPNMDVENYDNPYGYFNRIMGFAFIRKIGDEHEELYTQYKLEATELEIMDMPSHKHEFIEKYEQKLRKKADKYQEKRSSQKIGIEEFFDE